MIGPNVTLATPMHPLLPEERNIQKREDGSIYNLEYAKPITIKDNCWLASNVVVCGGVTIGEGCVIGAGSVVTKDIPPYSLAAGNPCRVIRQITEKDRMETAICQNKASDPPGKRSGCKVERIEPIQKHSPVLVK